VLTAAETHSRVLARPTPLHQWLDFTWE
jgi:hypothetical protein